MRTSLKSSFVVLVVMTITIALDPGVLGAKDPKVALRTVDGRTQATVTLPGMDRDALEDKGRIEETMTVVEDGALGVMEPPNELLGKGTDQAVKTVQSVSDSAFSWIFRKLDFLNRKSDTKQAS